VTRALRFLSPEQIIVIHDTLLGATGGRGGGGPRGAAYEGVDAAAQAVKNSYYESLEELAAAYAVYIAQGHVFADGNKRTGAATMLTFLARERQTHRDLGRASRSDDDRVAAARRIRGGRRATGPLDGGGARQAPAAAPASTPTPDMKGVDRGGARRPVSPSSTGGSGDRRLASAARNHRLEP